MIRVVMADDHYFMRRGVQALLQETADIEMVGEAVDGEEAIEKVKQLSPDVVVMDIAMPHMSGLQAIEQIRALGLRTAVIVLSMHADETRVRHALRAGARGYVLKGSVPAELPEAIRAVGQGAAYLSPGISEAVLASLDASEPFDQLTPREREVLKLVAEGLTSAQIADRLVISVKTAAKHRANLMSKLDVHDVAGLTREAVKHGLIQFEE
jgi:DNA-binding NarL/FixJ family response regulator